VSRRKAAPHPQRQKPTGHVPPCHRDRFVTVPKEASSAHLRLPTESREPGNRRPPVELNQGRSPSESRERRGREGGARRQEAIRATVVVRAPLASVRHLCLGAREERAFLAARDRLVGCGRRVLGVHPILGTPPLDRARAGDAPAPQPPLGGGRIAHLVRPAVRGHCFLRDRERPPAPHGRLGDAVASRRGGTRPGALRRLASGSGRPRKRPGRRGRVRRVPLCAPLAGPLASPAERGRVEGSYPEHALRTSSTVFGIPAVSTSGPDSLTTTSSSIRTPMPRHSGATVPSAGPM